MDPVAEGYQPFSALLLGRFGLATTARVKTCTRGGGCIIALQGNFYNHASPRLGLCASKQL